MNLSFSTTWNERMGELAGQPTHFIEKIWNGLIQEALSTRMEELYYSENGKKFEAYSQYPAKLHTIREDKNDRWKVGNKIHFIINPRTPNRFQFAPVMEVKSIQKIDIYPNANVNCLYEGETENFKGMVLVDNVMLSRNDSDTPARNDGFSSVEDFFNWFNEDFSGKIISWVDLKY